MLKLLKRERLDRQGQQYVYLSLDTKIFNKIWISLPFTYNWAGSLIATWLLSPVF